MLSSNSFTILSKGYLSVWKSVQWIITFIEEPLFFLIFNLKIIVFKSKVWIWWISGEILGAICFCTTLKLRAIQLI